MSDLGRFSEADQDTIRSIDANLVRIAAEGRAAFGSDDANTLLGYAATLVLRIWPKGDCDGFLAGAGSLLR